MCRWATWDMGVDGVGFPDTTHCLQQIRTHQIEPGGWGGVGVEGGGGEQGAWREGGAGGRKASRVHMEPRGGWGWGGWALRLQGISTHQIEGAMLGGGVP